MRWPFLLQALLGAGALGGCNASDTGTTFVADERGYTPKSITIKRGQPATIEFRRTTDQTCARDVAIPDLKIEKALPLDEVVRIEIPASEPRTYTFQCGMAMFKGSIIVE